MYSRNSFQVTGYRVCVLSWPRNFTEAGEYNITVTLKNASGSESCSLSLPVITGASVVGNLTFLENNSWETFSLVDMGNGNYSYAYYFYENGTSNIVINASKDGFINGSNSYDFEVGSILGYFAISPTNPYQDVTTFFTIYQNNSDSLENLYINTTEIWFYTSNWSLVETVYLSGLSDQTISPRDSISDVYSRSFTTYSAGDYIAQIVLNYTYNGIQNTTVRNSTFSVRVRPTAPPSGPGGGGGFAGVGIGAPAIPLKFKKHPILRETVPKGLVVADMVVENPTTTEGEVRVNIGGLPPGWVKKIGEIGIIRAGETKVETISIEVPEDAEAGDYLVNLDVSIAGMSGRSYFVLRVIDFPEEYTAPKVFRTVDVDFINNISNVKITMQNDDTFRRSVYIYETIPKSVARSTRNINFITPPTRIINDEPVVLWILQDVQPQHRQDLTYDVEGITGEYEPYVYYLSEEVVAISVRTEEWVKITNIYVSPMTAGGSNNYITVELKNTYANPLSVTASLFTIENWRTTPEEIEVNIDARETKSIKFDVEVPSDTKAGTYAGVLFLRYQNTTVSKDIVMGVGVGVGIGIFGWEIVVIIAILFVVGVLINHILSKKAYKREVKRYAVREDRFKILNDIKNLIKKK